MESDSAVLTLVTSSFHHRGAKTEKRHNFALFALSDGGTSRPADVAEQSARAGACGHSQQDVNQRLLTKCENIFLCVIWKPIDLRWGKVR